MEQLINRYNGGLNKDLNKINFPNDKYYHLQNGRVLSDKGNTNFSISNVVGNSLFSTYIEENYIGFVIIGYCNIREDIVFFLAAEDNSGKGKIILYKKIGDSFSVFLLYEKDSLNFYISYPIEQDMVISRYESPSIIKIYWTDNYNNYRFLNIAPNEGTDGTSQANYSNVLSTDIDKIEILSEINFKEPEFVDYIAGNLNSGVIQYAYRLYNLNGNKTIFSPASSLIPLTKYNYNLGSEKLRGQSTGGQTVTDTLTGKGVRIKIELDSETISNFDKIEVISLWYSDKEGIPTIKIIDQKNISSTNYINDIGGTAKYGTLELEEYQALSYDFSCKTIAEKDNRIFAANIKENVFDIDYDARAVRYTITPFSIVYGENGKYRYTKDSTIIEEGWIESKLKEGETIYTGVYLSTGNVLNNLPENCDCINSYNLFLNDGLEFKFQSNGSTLGGTGINVSYKFEDSICYKIDNNTNLKYLNTDILSEIPSIYSTIEGLTQVPNIDFIKGSKKTFQRDEIYRFGIVFFDNKGRQSFVKWIGDIKMPSNKEIPMTIRTDTGIYARPIYPIFEINNIPTIDGKTLDYQIVYVKRESTDKSIISQGIGGCAIKENIDSEISVCPFEITDAKDYSDGYYTDPGGTIKSMRSKVLEYISPDINFDKTFVTHANNKLELVGLLKKEGIIWRSAGTANWQTDVTAFDGDDGYQVVRKYSSTISCNGSSSTIGDLKVVIPGSEDPNKIALAESLIHNYYVKRYDATEPHGGLRGTGGMIYIEDELTLDETLPDLNDYIFLLNIRREVVGYGGNTFNDRQLNTYIPASKLNANECFNGDTFICMYDYLRCIQDIGRDGRQRVQEVLYFPLESKYNLYYRYDDSFSRIKDNNDEYVKWLNEVGYTDLNNGIDWTDLYLYDDVYSKVDNSKVFSVKPVNYNSNIIYDTQIKYSENKLNNEELDSWLIFKPNNINEVNGGYGKINSLVEFNDNIFVFQEKGISIAAISKQILISDNLGAELVLGKGDILDSFQYITTEIGLQGRNKVIKSLSALYWLDLHKKKVYTLAKGIESLDDLKGLNSWFEYGISDNTVMTGIYDNKYTEVLLTFRKLVEEIIEVEDITNASTTIEFKSISPGTQVSMFLNGIYYTFYASDTNNSGQYFKVSNPLNAESIDNFVACLNRFTNSNYDIDVTYGFPFKVTINALSNSLGNFATNIKSTNFSTFNSSSSTEAKNGIFTFDYSQLIKKNNTVFFIDCFPGGWEDKFELYVNNVLVESSNMLGRNRPFDTATYTSDTNYVYRNGIKMTLNPNIEWFIGTAYGGHGYNSSVVPTYLEEFHQELTLPSNTIPMLTMNFNGNILVGLQRIWCNVNVGDKLELKVIGPTVDTGWGVIPGIVETTTSDINYNVVDKEYSYTKYTVLKRDSILDATSNGNLINVESTDYFNLRVGNKYNIGNITSKLESATSNSFTFDKSFLEGNIDLTYYAKYNDNFTVAYNEAIQEFTGFYDFIPELYVKLNSGFLTTIDNKILYLHNQGNYGEFYGKLFSTYIDIISTNDSTDIKEYNNLKFYTEIYENNQIKNTETLYSILVENDYQQSEEVVLYVHDDNRYILYTEGDNIPSTSVNFNYLANVRRVIDHWKTCIPRAIVNNNTGEGDYNPSDYTNDYNLFVEVPSTYIDYNRIRSPYAKFRLKFVNNNNKKFILNQVSVLFQPMIV